MMIAAGYPNMESGGKPGCDCSAAHQFVFQLTMKVPFSCTFCLSNANPFADGLLASSQYAKQPLRSCQLDTQIPLANQGSSPLGKLTVVCHD